jgi:membrane dipeptidase
MSTGLVVDAHLDLSMNALEWNRDLTRGVLEIRAREAGRTDKPDRGKGTVALPEMRRGRVGLCVATQIARYVAPGNPLSGWHSQEQAWAQTQGQLAWYRAMEARGEMRQITDLPSLTAHLDEWRQDAAAAEANARLPIGYVLSLEGADSIVDMSHLERAYANGLRAVGPAHYGPGVHAFGTDSEGGIGRRGQELLQMMDRLGIILDATHLCDISFWEALDVFRGPVWASHSNTRALVAHNRQFDDDQLRVLIERGAVIGAAFDAWMIVPDWKRGQSTPADRGVTLDKILDHVDHICQLAGNAAHVGIGSDLDGAFGKEQCPTDIETIADLSVLRDRLTARGWAADDIDGFMSENWIRCLTHAWRS